MISPIDLIILAIRYARKSVENFAESLVKRDSVFIAILFWLIFYGSFSFLISLAR